MNNKIFAGVLGGIYDQNLFVRGTPAGGFGGGGFLGKKPRGVLRGLRGFFAGVPRRQVCFVFAGGGGPPPIPPNLGVALAPGQF